MESKNEGIDANEIEKGTSAGLKKYEPLTFLEKFAMYMGVAQLLELRLKQIAVKDFGQNFNSIERLTLGQMLTLLKKEGIREDFILFANPVKEARNHIAHDILANEIIWHTLTRTPKNHYTKSARMLDKSIYELEQLFFLLEWNDENGIWKVKKAPNNV